MNFYALIASLVSSLAWPALIAWIIWLLLRGGYRLDGLIQTIRKYVKSVKVGSVELTLQDARKEAEEVAAEQGESLGEAAPPAGEAAILTETAPAYMVLEIWKLLETEIVRLQQHNGLVRFTTPSSFMKLLRDKKKITDSEYRLFMTLREIRNQVVHSREPQPITPTEVVEYRTFVATLIRRFEKLKEELGYIDLPKKD